MDYIKTRELMVKNQLRPNGISSNKILDLFLSVPKENFLSNEMKPFAYIDNEILINKNAYYLSNLNIAKLIQYSNLNINDNLLHIGSLSGYVTVILSKLVQNVTAIEKNIDLYNLLEKNLKQFNISNASAYNINYEGRFNLDEKFDIIFMDLIVEYIPEIILSKLNDNGRLITIERVDNNLSKGIRITKNNNNFFKEKIFDSMNDLSTNFKKKEEFEF